MKSICLTLLCTIYLNGSFCQLKPGYSKSDQAKLSDLPVKWEHFWNIHNMDSMGTMLNAHVDFVNVAGVWLKGKVETIRDHKEKHVGIVFKNSVWTTDTVAIKYIKPDVAVIHLGWGISGDNDPDGTPRKPRHGMFTWIVIKENGTWTLLTVQNTNKR